ncbi:hypothetical protein [Aliiroseovarius marinus]|uniref:hypothetical protein n=1 Tax=Aliiroseovarius marinus TaxID=2500159 RepID=UPI003D7EBDCE
MRFLILTAICATTLTACQSNSTTAVSSQPVPEMSGPARAANKRAVVPTQQRRVTCTASNRQEVAQLDQSIAQLDRAIARGYKTENSPVRIANPLKLCKGFGLASVCLPSPKISSSLPSYRDHKAMKTQRAELAERRAQLVTACGGA